MNQSDLDHLEAQARHVPWSEVSIEPDPREVAAIEEEIPQAWNEFDHEALTDQQIQQLYGLTDEELAQKFDIQEGDIEENARQAMTELNINTQQIINERQLDASPNQSDQNRSDLNHSDSNQSTINQSNENTQDIDFGR